MSKIMKTIDYSNTVITGGFWKQKQDLIRKTTVRAVYDRFKETGRIDAFKCDWKEGKDFRPHFFWDSDVAKWMEGVAYLTAKKREPGLEKIVDRLVDLIEKNRCADGYFNIYFEVVEPEKRFTDWGQHELYCAGHLTEAAVAYYQATGKRKFLDLMCDYMNCIEKHFVTDCDTGFDVPGHEEIELALVRLYECTGNERYLNLSKHFIDARNPDTRPTEYKQFDPRYIQKHLPVREQREAVGHAVRAVYLYCGMADIAERTNDAELKKACEALFDDIYNKKMYITGGIGSSSCGEAFTVPYDLSNLLAYTESCAALGLALFANRMLRMDADSRYSDTIERILYNGFMSSTSLDGTAFFYENPLEIIPYLHTRDGNRYDVSYSSIHWPQMERSKVFSCSCCPPNIVRFIPSIANMLYTDDGETLYIHQYMQSKTDFTRGGAQLHVEQKTDYPTSGKVKITLRGGSSRVAFRVPWWCEKPFETVKGYVYRDLADGETLEIDFGMPIRFIEARPEVYFDCGRYAVMRGPVLYCMESVDNGDYLRDIRLDSHARFTAGKHPELGVPTLTVKAYRRRHEDGAPLYSVRHDSLTEMRATLIPYYAFANRGKCEMQTFHFVK